MTRGNRGTRLTDDRHHLALERPIKRGRVYSVDMGYYQTA